MNKTPPNKMFTPYEKPVIDEFKGNPVIKFSDQFSFGLSKARLVVKFFTYIQKFVDSEGKSIE